jgi:hypothetical protein
LQHSASNIGEGDSSKEAKRLTMKIDKVLTPRMVNALESMRGEFAALVERMQTSEAKAAGRALFSGAPRRPRASACSPARWP